MAIKNAAKNPKKSGVKYIIIIAVAAVLAPVVTVTGIATCGGRDKAGYDNETDKLIFSTLEVDKVFNPFFSTSATDSAVVGMTQLGMISNDKYGKPVCGRNEPTVTEDLETVKEGTGEEQTTTYMFVLKNNVKFSDGSPLTIKDVLFNLYVYLDPVYSGSSTIYSTDIVGLKDYRTQSSSEYEQKEFRKRFRNAAELRINALVEAADEILKDNPTLDADEFEEKLGEKESESEANAHLTEDYIKATELFKEELKEDYSSSRNSFKDMIFKDKQGKKYENLFTTDTEVFLYGEGLIKWNKKEGRMESDLADDLKELKKMDETTAINNVFDSFIPSKISEVVRFWKTASTFKTYLENHAMEEYFGKGHSIKNISGIEFVNRKDPVKVNGKEYKTPSYNADGSVKEGNEVLSIKINKVDPKAIWNFSFGVAPMKYYSDEKHIKEFDFESNFGVEFGSQTFMNDVVKIPRIGVPIGAGPYAASRSSGGIENIQAGDFYDKGVIYFERNPHFVLGAPKIKKVRYQVVSSAQMLNQLYNKAIDFAEPNAKVETVEELKGKKKDGINYRSIKTSGYGYIGVNAGKVKSMKVRQAIMHSINTLECVRYYKTTAEAIYRPMSTASWAYPKGCTSYYPFIGGEIPADLERVNPDYRKFVEELGKKPGDKFTEEEQTAFIRGLAEEAGYSENSGGIYEKDGDVLSFTFTIAGEETDHPAFDAMLHSQEILGRAGFDITVRPDANALKKLSSGSLSVWAAAWGSTIDPDMYQVYHMDSKATSTLNWGYRQILDNVNGAYSEELKIVEELSGLIDEGRKIIDEKTRADIYSEALDKVMELAVELPTYQRDDLFAYNGGKIDENSLTKASDCSPYNGLVSRLWDVSFVS